MVLIVKFDEMVKPVKMTFINGCRLHNGWMNVIEAME
jgi:hypothetical protein